MSRRMGAWTAAAVLLAVWLLSWRNERQARSNSDERYRRFLGFLASIRNARR
jgi:DMSO/TMAO reductase YedYZ heme-binding membrane subunit